MDRARGALSSKGRWLIGWLHGPWTRTRAGMVGSVVITLIVALLPEGMAPGSELLAQFGDLTARRRPPGVVKLPAASVTSVAAGGEHTLALKRDGTVWVWGYNSDGEHGTGNYTAYSVAGIQVPGLTNVTAVAASSAYSLALRGDGAVRGEGTVWHWGRPAERRPEQVPGLSGVTAIAAGAYHGLAMRRDGTLWAWGSNREGQLGLGDRAIADVVTPVEVPGLSGVTAIAAADRRSLAVTRDGTVWAWGYGSPGDGTFIPSRSPARVPGLTAAIAVATATWYTVALRNDGTVWAWGEPFAGDPDDPSFPTSWMPTAVQGISGATSLVVGGGLALALDRNGSVWAWGKGIIGDGKTRSRVPTQVPGLTGVATIAAGRSHSVALRTDRTLWAWGLNHQGQIGDGTRMDRTSPVRVTAVSN